MLGRRNQQCGGMNSKRDKHAFIIIYKREKRDVHLNEMKLRVSIQKINADFPQNIKAAMSIELTRTLLIMTFEQALMIVEISVTVQM